MAGPTVQRTGSRSFPIASASSVSRAVVVVRHAKRCSDTGIPSLTPEFPPLTPEFPRHLTPKIPRHRNSPLTPEFPYSVRWSVTYFHATRCSDTGIPPIPEKMLCRVGEGAPGGLDRASGFPFPL